jgi:hypothetical protein
MKIPSSFYGMIRIRFRICIDTLPNAHPQQFLLLLPTPQSPRPHPYAGDRDFCRYGSLCETNVWKKSVLIS